MAVATNKLVPSASTMAQTNANSLRDIKPPVEIPNGWLWAIWIFVGLMLAAALFWLYRYWRERRGQAPEIPPVPAHVRARQRLEEALRIIEQPKPFCTLVSDTTRMYLEERFNFHAPDRTTEEFLHELRSTSLLTPDQKESLGDFLQQCDLVKFARYEPTQTELRNLHGSAVRLVDETEPVETIRESVNK